jgi:hypothetical protein
MKTIGFILFTVGLLVACSSSPETYTIEIIYGVKHIHNLAPKWGDKPKMKLEFVQKIGSLESEDENFMFFRLTDIGVDNDENLYILDAGNYRIQKFDKNGRFILSFGRKGQGPGEILSAGRLVVGNNDLIYVVDEGNRKIQTFNPDGKYQRSFRLSWAMSLCLLNTGEMVYRKALLKPNDDITGWARLIEPDGNIIKDFITANEIGKKSEELQKSAFYLAVDSNDNIYAAFLGINKILKYSSKGEIILCADRPLPFKTGESFNRKIKSARSGQIRKIDDINLVSNGAEIDYKGRLWILTFARSRMDFEDSNNVEMFLSLYEFHVFNSEGIFLGRVPVNVYFDRYRIFKNRLYYIDMVKKMCVYEYKIVDL